MSDTPDGTHTYCDNRIKGMTESLRHCVNQRERLERKVLAMGTVATANEQVMTVQRDRVKALEAKVTALKAQLRDEGREL